MILTLGKTLFLTRHDTALFFHVDDGIERLDQLEKSDKTGKWIVGFSDIIDAVPKLALIIGQRLAPAAKAMRSNNGRIIACVYMDTMDTQAHKRLLAYFLWKGIIPKTNAGKLTNISFKLNIQTRAGEYGKNFKARLSLGDLIDLKTGAWTYEGKEIRV